ncbi:activating signal cointegrator 1 complex subunit 2 homolog [Austrofundulus limnaeus]|uniref:Activating signal cointegrator 1 complex subunit 2 homolog n=1 Tax=Austrofundulus limnaeus TaxID=52670 RepID=A0A2I4BSQ3_AUSLI|nr:PREDICTED: activating signal cointegrator 1 complex subunit 2 homolog [Austrofundulus limnaeus]
MSSLLIVVEDMQTLLRLQLLFLLAVGGHQVNAYRLDGKWENEKVLVSSQLDPYGFNWEDDSSWDALGFYTNPWARDSGNQAQQPPWVPRHLEQQNQLKLPQHSELPSYLQQPQHPKGPHPAKHLEVTNYPQLPWYPQDPSYYSPRQPQQPQDPRVPIYSHQQQHHQHPSGLKDLPQQPQNHEGPEGTMFLFQKFQQPKSLRYLPQIPEWPDYLPQGHQYPQVQNVPDYLHHHQHCPHSVGSRCMPQQSQQLQHSENGGYPSQQPQYPMGSDYLPQKPRDLPQHPKLPGFPPQQSQREPSNLQQQTMRIHKPRYAARKARRLKFVRLRPPMLRFLTRLRH